MTFNALLETNTDHDKQCFKLTYCKDMNNDFIDKELSRAFDRISFSTGRRMYKQRWRKKVKLREDYTPTNNLDFLE